MQNRLHLGSWVSVGIQKLFWTKSLSLWHYTFLTNNYRVSLVPLKPRRILPDTTRHRISSSENGSWRLRYHRRVQHFLVSSPGRPRCASRGPEGGSSNTLDTSRMQHQELIITQADADWAAVLEMDEKLKRQKKSRGILVCSIMIYCSWVSLT